MEGFTGFSFAENINSENANLVYSVVDGKLYACRGIKTVSRKIFNVYFLFLFHFSDLPGFQNLEGLKSECS